MLNEDSVLNDVQLILTEVFPMFQIPDDMRENFESTIRDMAKLVVKLYCNKKNSEATITSLFDVYKESIDNIVASVSKEVEKDG